MNILLISLHNPFYSSSASANRMLTLIEGLENHGAEIEMIVTNGYQTRDEMLELGVNGIFKGVKYFYSNTSIVDTIWKKRYYLYIGNKLSTVKLFFLLKKRITSFKGVVWVPSDLVIMKLVYKLKRKNRDVKLFSELSEFLDIHKFNKGNILQKRLADRRQHYFESYIFKELSGLALMTKTLMNHYKVFSVGPELLHLPMTVDLDRFKEDVLPLEDFHKPYIVFVGVMNDAKDGVNILIESFYKIAEKYFPVNLYLVGGWNYDTPAHLKRIEELGLKDRVFWKGEYQRNKIPSIIKHADALVLPRPNSKQAEGGFPTKLGEYLATGNPVCATTVGEIPDYLTDNESVFFAEPGSAVSFAEALSRALRADQNSKRIGQKGKEVAEKYFNKDIQAKSLYQFLKQISNENSK